MCTKCDALEARLFTSHRLLSAMKDDLDEAYKVASLASTKEAQRLRIENARLLHELEAQGRVLVMLNKKLVREESRV